jgi:hypothetical protein
MTGYYPNKIKRPDVIYTMVGVPEIRDDVHDRPQNMLPPPPPPPIGKDEIPQPPLPPMPALPVFDAAYFGVETCNYNSTMIELCDQANPVLFALRREIEGGASLCSCHDPFTGKVTRWNQECSKSCPSEDGNTCVERRAADLATLEHARKSGYFIGRRLFFLFSILYYSPKIERNLF